MSIQEIVLKIKGWVGEKGFDRLVLGTKVFLLVSGTVLGCFSCFLWGKTASQRVSAQAEPIRVIYPPQPVTDLTPSPSPARRGEPHQASKNTNSTITSTPTNNWKFAASKTGKVYYPNGCAAVNRIKPENRIYFTSREQAETKGLTPSKACS